MTPADERLVAALQAEHAAIFGYGALGPRLEPAIIDLLAREPEAAHRARRDALLIRLASKGVTPPPSAPTYSLPFQVSDRTAALELALIIEERTAAIYRLARPDTAGEERKLALDALVDCAVRAARIRRNTGTSPATVAFPGKTSS